MVSGVFLWVLLVLMGSGGFWLILVGSGQFWSVRVSSGGLQLDLGHSGRFW